MLERLDSIKELNNNLELICEDLAFFNNEAKTYECNFSDVFSTLIKEAGTMCDCYASDILFDIERIKSTLNGKQEPVYIAFRSHGVDSNTFIAIRGWDYEDYKSIFKVEFQEEEDNVTVVVKLYKCK